MILDNIMIAFVDDTSFYTNEIDYQTQIQSIVEEYIALYEAIGSYIEHQKTMYFC